MAVFSLKSASGIASALFVISIAFAPAQAASPPDARLVHCGKDTCLRISGHRSSTAIAITVGDRAFPVTGGRSWQMTMPLAAARVWSDPSGSTLTFARVDSRTGETSIDTVALPPGALGRPVELATLLVRAH